MKTIKIKQLREVRLPVRAHSTDAGLDLYIPNDLTPEQFPSRESKPGHKIPLGIAIEVPEGYMAQVVERSSVAAEGIIFAKAPIDSGYTGEIHAIMVYNGGTRNFLRGEKIAQLIISPIATPDIEIVAELKQTERGDGGFGSTGK